MTKSNQDEIAASLLLLAKTDFLFIFAMNEVTTQNDDSSRFLFICE